MAEVEIKGYGIRKRYGGVLFDLARETKTLERVLKEVACLQACVAQDSRAWSYAIRPTLPLHTQQKIVESLAASLKLGTLMTHFLVVLCKNRRLQNLKPILEGFLERSEQAQGLLKGVVETALELTPKEQRDLEKSLSQQLRKEVSLQQVVRKDLIAGVVVRLGSLMVDASLETRFNKLRLEMKG